MKICVADGQSRVRHGLRVLLEQQPGWKVIGEAADTQELLEQVRNNCPDLVLFDWGLPGIPATELLSCLRKLCPALRVILMSGRHELRQTTIEAGADAFASKTESPERLVTLIREFNTNLIV